MKIFSTFLALSVAAVMFTGCCCDRNKCEPSCAKPCQTKTCETKTCDKAAPAKAETKCCR